MAETEFQVGDVVTRTGDDRHLVLEVGGYGDITVECFAAPKGGSCKAGERELNLAGRYQLVCRDHAWIDVTTMNDPARRRECAMCGVEQVLVVR